MYRVWPKLGGFLWAISLDPLTRHVCDYTRKLGKIRVKRSEAAREGWLELQIKSLEIVDSTAWMKTFSIPLGECEIEVADGVGLEFPGTPMFRVTSVNDNLIELASRDELTGELTPLQFLGIKVAEFSMLGSASG